jgi:hypothetical protein
MKKYKEFFLGPFIFGEQINAVPFTDNHFFFNIPVSRKKELMTTGQGVFKKQNPKLNFSEINSHFFRSENFKNDHDGLHVLFAGCSYTFGHGMGYDNVWSKIVYDKIASKNKLSGYFNIGVGGASIMESVSLIFKYCRTYGNPDVIFLNMPNFGRFYSLDGSTVRFSFLVEESDKVLDLLSYQYYLMLDTYCRSMGIKLYSFTWSFCENNNYLGIRNSCIYKFNTYHQYDLSEVDRFVKKYLYDFPESNIMADDKEHLGEPYHNYWANFIYERYIDDNPGS